MILTIQITIPYFKSLFIAQKNTPGRSNSVGLHPNVAKAGGLQSQGVEGEVVVVYRESLTTQDLKSSGFPEG